MIDEEMDKVAFWLAIFLGLPILVIILSKIFL